MRLTTFCAGSIFLHASICLWAPGIAAQSTDAAALARRTIGDRTLLVWLPGGPAEKGAVDLPAVGPSKGLVTAPAPEADRGVDLARYYRLSEVTERPQIRQQVEPEFPLAVEPGTTGTVRVRLFIGESGTVDRVVVERAVPEGVFDQAAIDAFRKASFQPARIGGKRVKAQLAIEVDFQSRGRP